MNANPATRSTLVSQSELSRRLNLPARTIANAIKSGKIAPDTVALGGRLNLFDAERIDEIRTLLDAVRLEAAVSRRNNPVGIEL